MLGKLAAYRVGATRRLPYWGNTRSGVSICMLPQHTACWIRSSERWDHAVAMHTLATAEG